MRGCSLRRERTPERASRYARRLLQNTHEIEIGGCEAIAGIERDVQLSICVVSGERTANCPPPPALAMAESIPAQAG